MRELLDQNTEVAIFFKKDMILFFSTSPFFAHSLIKVVQIKSKQQFYFTEYFITKKIFHILTYFTAATDF